MQQSVDHNLIKKYLQGQCSPEEESRVKAFLQQPEARQMFEAVLNEGWNDVPQESGQQMTGWKARFNQRIGKEPVETKRNEPAIWLKYAAVWAAFIIVAGGMLWKYTAKDSQPFAVVMQQTVNTHGKLVKIKLSDSSTVMVNAATKLRYPENFNGKTREVYLDGEAFFDIKHDTEHPFIVHTPSITVNVLGTSFNVKAYTGDKNVSVAVATGKVGVLAKGKGSKAIMLFPGDQLAYNLDDLLTKQTKVAIAEVSAWQTGMFVYHNETLANICRQLERWYGVDINIQNNATAQMRFNLKQKNDSLENVLNTLMFAGKIHYRINGKQVTIW